MVWFCLDRLLVVRASTPALLLFDFKASLLEGLGKLFNHDGGLLEGSQLQLARLEGLLGWALQTLAYDAGETRRLVTDHRKFAKLD